MDADSVEVRVLGSLVEKQRTTPDVYPLSLNALRAACNQSTNRDPVVEYDEATIRAALERLSRREWVRLASGPGSRAAKYRHLLSEALGVSDAEPSLLAVLMLRGPQTSAELRARVERLYSFRNANEVDATLAALEERDLVVLQPRRPGQKEQRFAHLLSGAPQELEPPERPATPFDADRRIDELEERVARLEAEVAALRDDRG